MIVWVLYDIKDDKARNAVAKACKQAGLYRVQYSCFLGKISASMKDGLELLFEAEIDDEVDKVYVFKMNKDNLKECTMLGQAFDEKMVTDEVKSLFF